MRSVEFKQEPMRFPPTFPLTFMEKESFRLWLQRQFTERCKRNSSYSLRTFARSLRQDPGTVSQILSGKRAVSKKGMHKLCEQLTPTPRDLRAFGLIAGPKEPDRFDQIELDAFLSISDWYYAAILELTYVKGFNPNPRWIAKKLEITPEEAKTAIERLKRLGLLVEANGSLVKSSKHLSNLSSVSTSGAHRELQRQVIEKALKAVEDCPSEDKDITSMTMAIDPSKLDEAREEIKKFRRRLCALLEDGSQHRVYNLAIQLYPVSGPVSGEESS